jgi:DNA-binding transcriptional ArsR family regulator
MVKYDEEMLSQTFSARADPTRRKIIEALRADECVAGQVAHRFDMSWPAVSRHLRILENAGLLDRRKDGRIHHLRLNPEPLQQAMSWIESHQQLWRACSARADG